jgi:hypothetical protein
MHEADPALRTVVGYARNPEATPNVRVRLKRKSA